MKRAIVLLLLAAPVAAQTWQATSLPARPLRPVHTFSIVARDPQTGEMGVAVQSHWFSVGSVVPWAEAGVGAVATQSFVDPSYGKLGLDLMRAGKSAPEALKALLAGDTGSEVRQVAFIDTQGRAASWTGGKDIAAAGGIVGHSVGGWGTVSGGVGVEGQQQATRVTSGMGQIGSDFAVQANLMSNDQIWPAMAKAYQETKGDLAERMLAALDAAQRAGGDIRGRQSAALIVVRAKSSGKPWEDRIFDLRVDDAAQPLLELRRLVTLQRAYNHMNAGDLAVEHKDNEAALREYSAAEKLIDPAVNPNVSGIEPSRLAEMIYWHAVALVNMNRVDESLPLFRRAFSIQPSWKTLTPRLPKSGLLPDDPKIMDKILQQSVTLKVRPEPFCQEMVLNGKQVKTCSD